jgi:hypothetical protein
MALWTKRSRAYRGKDEMTAPPWPSSSQVIEIAATVGTVPCLRTNVTVLARNRDPANSVPVVIAPVHACWAPVGATTASALAADPAWLYLCHARNRHVGHRADGSVAIPAVTAQCPPKSVLGHGASEFSEANISLATAAEMLGPRPDRQRRGHPASGSSASSTASLIIGGEPISRRGGSPFAPVLRPGLSPPGRDRWRLRAVGRQPRLGHRKRRETWRSSASVASAGSLQAQQSLRHCRVGDIAAAGAAPGAVGSWRSIRREREGNPRSQIERYLGTCVHRRLARRVELSAPSETVGGGAEVPARPRMQDSAVGVPTARHVLLLHAYTGRDGPWPLLAV